MSEVAVSVPVAAPEAGKWPGGAEGGVSPPPGHLAAAALANAAARAAASNSRRDLIEYLRMRRKSA